MNKVILCGNLTKDIEIRYTQSGKAIARMSIAINQGCGEKQTTDFFNLVAWEKTAELCGKYLHKGSKVLVEGRLKTNNYEKDGVKHYGVDVIVESVEFVNNKNSSEKRQSADDKFDGDYVNDDDMPF